MIDSSEISVVVQGAVIPNDTKECLQSIRKNLPKAEIILSTWQGADISGLSFDKIILSKDPGSKYVDIAGKVNNNVNRQIVSTQAGLKQAKRKYILKFRTDFTLESNEFLKYWNKYAKRNWQYMLFKHRVLVDVLFSRFNSDETGRPTPFHVSDFWMFGYAEDIKNYYEDIPLVKEEDLGSYTFAKPNQLPYRNMTCRYAPEQYLAVSFVKKYYPQLQFDDWTDFSEDNINLSNNFIYNNFIFLSFEQSGVWAEKHANTILNENLFYGIINHYYFQKMYQEYCEKLYIPSKIYVTDGKHLYGAIYNQIVRMKTIICRSTRFLISFLYFFMNLTKYFNNYVSKLWHVQLVIKRN